MTEQPHTAGKANGRGRRLASVRAVWAWGLALGLLAALVCVASLWVEYEEAVARVQADGERGAQAAADYTRQRLLGATQTLQISLEQVRAAGDLDRADLGALRERLRLRLPADGLVRGLAVLDGHGELLLSTTDEVAHSLDRSSRLRLTQHTRHANALRVGAALRHRTSGQWVLPLSAALPLAADATKPGLLLALVDPQPLQAFFSSVRTDNQAVVALVLPDGSQALTAGPATALGVAPQDQHARVQTQRMGTATGTYLASWQVLPEQGVQVVFAQQQAQAMRPYLRRAMVSLSLLGLIWAVLALAVRRVVVLMRSQQALTLQAEASEARWKGLASLSTDWYWEQDAQFRFTHIGQRATAPDGQAPQSLLGKRRWDFAALNMSEQDWERHRAVVRAQLPFRNLELRRADVNGQQCWAEVSGEPIFGADGRFAGYRGVGRDISERKRAEQQRQGLEAQLREAQKLESLGTLAGGIAHDFNNVLGAILGNTSLVRASLGAEHPAQARLSLVHNAGLRARGLVQQILAFSRRQVEHFVPVHLNALVQEVAELMRSTLPAEVELVPLCPAQAVWVRADANQLHQVLVNLCTNAWHALGVAGGRIELGLGLQPGQQTGEPAGARLWVRDNGCGINPELRERIFEPFFTTKQVGQGTGLGLSVVHGIVDAHHGRIEVHSAPGQGSCFEVLLPLCEPGQQAVANVGSALPGAVVLPEAQGRRVLCVDDDEVMLLTTEALLQQMGFHVLSAHTPEAALQWLQDHAEPLHAMVTDYHMPRTTGLQLATMAQTMRPGMPVVIASGYISKELYRQAHEMPNWALVKKENAYAELPRTLQRLLAGHPVEA